MFVTKMQMFFNRLDSTLKLIFFIGTASCYLHSRRGTHLQSKELQPIRRYTNGLPMRYPNPYSPEFPDQFLNRYPWRYAKNNPGKGRRPDRFLVESREIDPRNDFELKYRRFLQKSIKNFASKKRQLDPKEYYKKTEEPVDIKGVKLSKDRFTKYDEEEEEDREEEDEYDSDEEPTEEYKKPKKKPKKWPTVREELPKEPLDEYDKGEEPAVPERPKKKPKRRPPVEEEEEEDEQEPIKSEPKPRPEKPRPSRPKVEGLEEPSVPEKPEMPKSVYGSSYSPPSTYFPKDVKKKAPWSFSIENSSDKRVSKETPNNDWN